MIVSANFSHALFPRLSTCDDLVMALVWFLMVWFGTSYTNLR